MSIQFGDGSGAPKTEHCKLKLNIVSFKYAVFSLCAPFLCNVSVSISPDLGQGSFEGHC